MGARLEKRPVSHSGAAIAGWALALVSSVGLSLLVPASAEAHRPYFGDGFGAAEDAFQVADPEISIVVYKELSVDSPELWLEVNTEDSFPLYMQLGVPRVDRLLDFAPSMVLLHRDLPPIEEALPFEVPEGFGGVVMHSNRNEVPDEFYEPFTATESWVWLETTVDLPSGGTSYVVAFDDRDVCGKVWLSLGTVEDFSDVTSSQFGDWLVQVNAFHETGRFEDVPDAGSFECEIPEEVVQDVDGGCAYQGTSRGQLGPILSGLLLVLFRKRLRESRTGQTT